ncbi:beta-lactamase/transpeptidase-like protein [Tothia fuscella]|uniref:Beta-lactamase/transpeptidase-like protein n=1 Tax=Tothia fuscella TaxID=1048955 RepID=A0A9P4U3I3_9PEZI|nr:beta-lactamase/transpeptidase-like protein [Tothia fuscella]
MPYDDILGDFSQDHASNSSEVKITPSGLTKAQVESRIKDLLIKSQIPAAAVVIISSERRTTIGCGIRKHGYNAKVTPDDTWMVGPMSSTMVSLILARLIERKLLSWSDPLEDLLPDFLDVMHLSHRKTNLKMLSSHSSGITTKLPEIKGGDLAATLVSLDSREGRRRTLESVFSRPSERTPGTGSAYRNAVNLIILAAIIETTTSSE